MTNKKEIKINKLHLIINIKMCLFSLFVSFVALFVIASFGKIKLGYTSYVTSSDDISELGFETKYNGVLTGGHDYRGAARIENPNRLNNFRYIIHGHIFYDGVQFTSLNFIQKTVLFYIPVMFYEGIWLWIILSIIIFSALRLIEYFKSNFTIKFE